ncbi:MAG TPA: TetR/AcrR family transcriptional regulator [Actinomycetota bacterium]|nr:TetR/AcrR family transcriptional regulator [Actinomycetota bacterium]
MAQRRLSAEARRAQLIAIAREVFVEDGYDGAGMEAIATRAGVTKPVLYQHFESKKELYLALLGEDMAALQGRVEGALDSAKTNRERIERGLAAYFEFIEQNEGSFHLLFRETLGSEPDFREVVERFRDSVAARIGKIIAEETSLPIQVSELLARGVMGMGESAAQWWLEGRSVDKREVLKDLSELAWRGLSGLPRRES